MSVSWRLEQCNVLDGLPFEDESVHCCVTSPPYWEQGDYGVDGQIGLEATSAEYVERIVQVFREVRRVLRPDGTAWLNLGDGYRDKSLLGLPWRVALALREDGWCLRSEVIWHKPNPWPEPVEDRPTKAHEHLFLLTRSPRYHYDAAAIMEAANPARQRGTPARTIKATGTVGTKRADYEASRRRVATRNKRSVWAIPVANHKGVHFAVFPEALVEPCILAGCPEGGTVLDPFTGSGTTGAVALRRGRSFVGCELNPAYIELAEERIAQALAESGRATPANLPPGQPAQLGLLEAG